MTSVLRDIGVCAQNWLIILGSILKTISETFTILQEEIEFSLRERVTVVRAHAILGNPCMVCSAFHR